MHQIMPEKNRSASANYCYSANGGPKGINYLQLCATLMALALLKTGVNWIGATGAQHHRCLSSWRCRHSSRAATAIGVSCESRSMAFLISSVVAGMLQME
jgi:hypothetical protein